MLSIAVTVGDVSTDIVTDQPMSFEGIETLLVRATNSTLDAYNRYVVVSVGRWQMLQFKMAPHLLLWFVVVGSIRVALIQRWSLTCRCGWQERLALWHPF